jgi:hypothetical protein
LPFLLVCGTCLAETPAPPIERAGPPGPLILQVQVVEGDRLSYAPGSRAVKGITVQVTDEVGRPVAGASVNFRLPEDGATGVFQNNTKTELASTASDGRASVWGMHWGKVPGSVTIHITAAKGQTRAGTVATQIIADGAAPGQVMKVSMRGGGGGGHKLLWFGLAAGLAGGGIAAYEVLHGASSSGAAGAITTTTATGVSVGAPQVTVGPPK